ncbi:hypothetical protein EVAR_74112_1 [Eumeta japonica]|uniref:Uncharacterized protein n=1 Tax=Eumeta variegata TaxID=151549 RepID=A0A4C1SJT9_EUMVA|nr:hypothetical protein EVAR_74112_1 [Eumeta japonica]
MPVGYCHAANKREGALHYTSHPSNAYIISFSRLLCHPIQIYRTLKSLACRREATNRLCAAAVSLLLVRIGRWSGREIARSTLSLARSAQAERDNGSSFFVRAAGVHRFIRRYHVKKNISLSNCITINENQSEVMFTSTRGDTARLKGSDRRIFSGVLTSDGTFKGIRGKTGRSTRRSIRAADYRNARFVTRYFKHRRCETVACFISTIALYVASKDNIRICPYLSAHFRLFIYVLQWLGGNSRC